MKSGGILSNPEHRRAVTRKEFLRQCGSAAAAAMVAATAGNAGAQSSVAAMPAAPAGGARSGAAAGSVFDLRPFVDWIVNELEPSVRLPGPAGHYSRVVHGDSIELYGVADMACILYTLGRLQPTEEQRSEWADAFELFQNPDTGWLLERQPTHTPLHNVAFALGAMNLLDLSPRNPVKMSDYLDPKAALTKLDWKNAVYTESHKGAGMGSIFALCPELGSPKWFADFFEFCDVMFDPRNGLMGRDKPAGGDYDQVGGTFHYSFLYNYFNRRMPFPEPRVDAVMRTRQPDGYWLNTNHLWLTLDAMYLMTRTVRYHPYRLEDVRAMVRDIMSRAMHDVYSPEGRAKSFTGQLGVHGVNCAISIAAEAQNFLGSDEVLTEMPLHLVLDRRPFI